MKIMKVPRPDRGFIDCFNIAGANKRIVWNVGLVAAAPAWSRLTGPTGIICEIGDAGQIPVRPAQPVTRVWYS
jgi:hypothetical protein